MPPSTPNTFDARVVLRQHQVHQRDDAHDGDDEQLLRQPDPRLPSKCVARSGCPMCSTDTQPPTARQMSAIMPERSANSHFAELAAQLAHGQEHERARGDTQQHAENQKVATGFPWLLISFQAHLSMA